MEPLRVHRPRPRSVSAACHLGAVIQPTVLRTRLCLFRAAEWNDQWVSWARTSAVISANVCQCGHSAALREGSAASWDPQDELYRASGAAERPAPTVAGLGPVHEPLRDHGHIGS